MDSGSKYILRKVITDVLCLFTVAIPLLIFKLYGKPYERGYFCDDESLMHPYKDSTVTSTTLYITGLFLPVLIMLVTEFVHYKHSSGQRTRTFLGRTIHPWVWNSYKVIGVFGFGVACSHLTTDIAKYSIGRLRPHFFEVCKPSGNCTATGYQNKYIENFKCLGDDPEKLKEVRLSFPSGHSSFSACTMIYLSMYLHSRMTWKGSKLLRHFIQFLCLMMAWGTALSRISDYKHHWSDVLAGSTQGAIAAILVVVFVSDLFPPQQLGLPVNVDTNSDLPSQSRDGGNKIY